MIIIKKAESNKISTSLSTTVREYLMDEQAISGAVAEINGRYPEQGFAINKVSKELVYILTGNGEVITQSNKTEFGQGDVILIDKNEQFSWQGNFSMFMVTTPKFDSKQHKVHDDI